MTEQRKLRDIDWQCANACLGCDAALPCFDASGQVRCILVVSREWGWLLAPAGRCARQDGGVAFAGNLEEMFRVSAQAVEQISGLFYFDPWWLVRRVATLPPEQIEKLVARNLAGARFNRLPVDDVAFDDALTHVQSLSSGSSLWRRQAQPAAICEWLAGSPFAHSGPLVSHGVADAAAGPSSPAGPLKLVPRERRVGGGRVVIGEPSASGPAVSPTGRPVIGQPGPSTPTVAAFAGSGGPLSTAPRTQTSRSTAPGGRTTIGQAPVVVSAPPKAASEPQASVANSTAEMPVEAIVVQAEPVVTLSQPPVAMPAPPQIPATVRNPEPVVERSRDVAPVPVRPADRQSRVPAKPAPQKPATSKRVAKTPTQQGAKPPEPPGKPDVQKVQEAIENIRRRIQSRR